MDYALQFDGASKTYWGQRMNTRQCFNICVMAVNEKLNGGGHDDQSKPLDILELAKQYTGRLSNPPPAVDLDRMLSMTLREITELGAST